MTDGQVVNMKPASTLNAYVKLLLHVPNEALTCVIDRQSKLHYLNEIHSLLST